MACDKTSRPWSLRGCFAHGWHAASAVILIALLVSAGPAVAQDEPPEEDEASTWSEVREAYEKAKKRAMAVGESVPDRIPSWVKEDLENAGDWEYRVVEAPKDELEATLNQLGAERWECFSVESGGKTSRMVFKRRKRSRLRELQDLSPDDLLTVIKLMRDHRLDKE